MIISKSITIPVNAKMVNKYNEMGFNVKVGELINLPIEKLTKYSHQYVLCACDMCGEQKQIKYNNYCKYVKKDTNGLYTCKICNLEKRKNTCVEKYGVDNISKLKSTVEKVKNTMIKNGTDYGLNTQKYKDTMIEKYGVEYPAQSKTIKNKQEETLFKNYGVRNPSQSSEIHMKQHSGYISKNYKGFHYRGTYEKDFIDYCLKNKIEIENFNNTIEYIFEEKKRKYFPDFYIKKLNMIVEIKSSYTYEIEKEQNEAKKEATLKSGFNFLFVIDKNYSVLQ